MSGSGYNIAIVGQTGVGKSSLLNYLLDLDPNDGGAKTGVGAPVTKNGFHQYKHKIKGIPVCVFDSWGLEVGKEDQWTKDLENELKNRGVDKPASKWFHSVFYCIAASGSRVQDADIKIIQKFRNEKYQVSVILTKADCVSEEDENALRDSLRKAIGDQNISVIAVCSESKKTRGGYTNTFGKDEVQKQSLSDLFRSLEVRVPEHCKRIMESEVFVWKANMYALIDKELSYFLGMNSEKIMKKIRQDSLLCFEKCLKSGDESLKACIDEYAVICEFISLGIASEKNKNFGNLFYFFEKNGIPEWALPIYYLIEKARSNPVVFLVENFLSFNIRKNCQEHLKFWVDQCCTHMSVAINKVSLDIKESLQSVHVKITEDLKKP